MFTRLIGIVLSFAFWAASIVLVPLAIYAREFVPPDLWPQIGTYDVPLLGTINSILIFIAAILAWDFKGRAGKVFKWQTQAPDRKKDRAIQTWKKRAEEWEEKQFKTKYDLDESEKVREKYRLERDKLKARERELCGKLENRQNEIDHMYQVNHEVCNQLDAAKREIETLKYVREYWMKQPQNGVEANWGGHDPNDCLVNVKMKATASGPNDVVVTQEEYQGGPSTPTITEEVTKPPKWLVELTSNTVRHSTGKRVIKTIEHNGQPVIRVTEDGACWTMDALPWRRRFDADLGKYAGYSSDGKAWQLNSDNEENYTVVGKFAKFIKGGEQVFIEVDENKPVRIDDQGNVWNTDGTPLIWPHERSFPPSGSHVGFWNDGDIVYGFDYTNLAPPRCYIGKLTKPVSKGDQIQVEV